MPDEGTSPAARVARICGRHDNDPAKLLEMLHEVQAAEGCVPEAAVPVIAEALNIAKAEVHGVVSFYHDFRRAPAGRVTVKVCRAEACQSMGALALIERICARHGISLGGTSQAGVTVEPVYCLGNCACAPAAMVGERLLGRLDAERLDGVIAEALA
jgi:formate dehydrogenase subunit gamma